MRELLFLLPLHIKSEDSQESKKYIMNQRYFKKKFFFNTAN